MRRLIFLYLFMMSLSYSLYAEATQVWYEPGNAGKGSGVSEDFHYIYSTPEGSLELTNALRAMDVYMISRSMLEAHYPFFRLKVVPKLIQYNIPVAIDTTAITWFGCKSEADKRKALKGEIRTIRNLQEMGLKVKYVTLQSILSKPPPKDYCKGKAYSLASRIDDVVNYARFIKNRFNGAIQVGITDALIAKYYGDNGDIDPKEAYTNLNYRLTANGIKLGFVIIDHPYDYFHKGSSIWKIKAMVNILKLMEIKVGLIVNSFSPNPSFTTNSLKYIDEVISSDLGLDFVLQTTWYEAVPRDSYQLKLVIHFAEKLKGISFYRFCTPQAYRNLESEVHSNQWYFDHPYTHFNTRGKYYGACAPVL